MVYKRRFNRNVDQSMSTRRKSASNLGMPGDDRLSQIAEKFSMDMFQMQRAASREDRQTDGLRLNAEDVKGRKEGYSSMISLFQTAKRMK